MSLRVILDTNVFVAALRSRQGASFRVLSLVGTGRFEVIVTVPLVLEYEDAMKRTAAELGLETSVVDDILDYVCSVAEHRNVYFLWRPLLRDPGDDFVLEAAVAGACSGIVTFNVADFAGSEAFGVRVMGPVELLRLLGEIT